MFDRCALVLLIVGAASCGSGVSVAPPDETNSIAAGENGETDEAPGAQRDEGTAADDGAEDASGGAREDDALGASGVNEAGGSAALEEPTDGDSAFPDDATDDAADDAVTDGAVRDDAADDAVTDGAVSDDAADDAVTDGAPRDDDAATDGAASDDAADDGVTDETGADAANPPDDGEQPADDGAEIELPGADDQAADEVNVIEVNELLPTPSAREPGAEGCPERLVFPDADFRLVSAQLEELPHVYIHTQDFVPPLSEADSELVSSEPVPPWLEEPTLTFQRDIQFRYAGPVDELVRYSTDLSVRDVESGCVLLDMHVSIVIEP